ncbi:MAG: MBL fold metallo-hydrolase [Lachnospiraceae bacterium]|nr:MBL fold metallo-hydrolase [Lachnospiraceae bacterium]
MKIYELHYSKTNTYLIKGDSGVLLFDTGWAGTFSDFCKAMGENGIAVQDINYILISHFHPDHMGIAQNIANEGAVILVADPQKEYIHSSDAIFAKEKYCNFIPIDDVKIKAFDVDKGSEILKSLGINGKVICTPGHSSDSVSLVLDEGYAFVGDLNPLYELELHKGTQIEDSWNKLLSHDLKRIYYGHAKTAELSASKKEETGNKDLYDLVSKIMKMTDKGIDVSRIAKKTGADKDFIADVLRMYLTHQNVGVQGILDRIEIKNK